MESNQVVYFRADGNEKIASGHILRCFSIAYELVQKGVSVTFVVADTDSEWFVQDQLHRFSWADQISVLCLNSCWKDLSQEIEQMQDLLVKDRPDCLLVDSYYVTENYFTSLSSLAKIAYLDDLMAFDYQVDLIINYDLEVDAAFYRHAKQCLLGSAYTPLRKEFQNSTFQVRERATQILLSTGGGDEFGLAEAILNAFVASGRSFLPLTFHVVVASLTRRRDALSQLSLQYPNIVLEETVTQMDALMEQCDLAITAGGTTLYELCAIGVPSVCYAMNDDQYRCIQHFVNKNLVRYAGSKSHMPDLVPAIVDTTFRYLKDTDARRQDSQKLRALFDGNGANRIAEALLAIS